MSTAQVFVFSPIPKEKAFAYAIAEIHESGKLTNGRDYDPESFESYEQFSGHMCAWLKEQGVTEATVTFVSLKKSATTGVEDISPVGEPHSFNPQTDSVQLGELTGSLKIE